MRFYLFVLLISLAVYKVLIQIHGPNIESLADASYGVIEGKPYWITFQNRLLGPYTVYIISKIGISYIESLKIYILIMTITQSILLSLLLKKAGLTNRSTLTYLVVFSFMYISIQHYWLYTWDNADLLLFILFSYFVFNKLTMIYYIMLFPIALLNRESALFISLFLVIDSFSINLSKLKVFDITIKLESFKKLIAGILMILVGISYTKTIRHYLYDSNAVIKTLYSKPVLGNYVSLSNNISDLFIYNLTSIHILNTIFIVGSICYLASFIKYYSECQIKAFIIYICIVINIVIFGTINETRMFIILIPFLIFFQVEIDKIQSESRVRYRL